MTLKLRTMTYPKWRRLRVKGFVRCRECSTDLYPNQPYYEQFRPDEDPKLRNLCKFCGDRIKEEEEE